MTPPRTVIDLGRGADFQVRVTHLSVQPVAEIVADSPRPTIQQLALEEIDLEIAIRQRIADTIQSRLTWASLLQDSLRTSTSGASQDWTPRSSELTPLQVAVVSGKLRWMP